MLQKTYVYGLYKKNFQKTSNIESGLFYIGITDNINRRTRNHKNIDGIEYRKSNNIIKKRIIMKYDFDMVIFWECDNRDEAMERETFLITWFGSLYDKSGILTNILYKGTPYNGSKFSLDEQKQFVDQWISSGLSSVKFASKLGMYCNTLVDWALKFYEKESLPLIKHSEDASIEKITDILEEFDKICHLISQAKFARNNNLHECTFKSWIRKYRPDILKKIQEYKINKKLAAKKNSKRSNSEKKQYVDEWIKSNISAPKFARQIGIAPNTLISWGRKFYNTSELPIVEMDGDWSIESINAILDEYTRISKYISKKEFSLQKGLKPTRIYDWMRRYRPELI